MSDWISWLVIAGIVVVLELFSGTFYLLMISIGLCAGALVAAIGWSMEFQLIAAALVGSIATILLRRSRFGTRSKVDTHRDPNVNLDIGQSIQVSEWKNTAAGSYTARSMYRGAQWDIACTSAAEPQPGLFKIVEIRGSQLIVEPT